MIPEAGMKAVIRAINKRRSEWHGYKEYVDAFKQAQRHTEAWKERRTERREASKANIPIERKQHENLRLSYDEALEYTARGEDGLSGHALEKMEEALRRGLPLPQREDMTRELSDEEKELIDTIPFADLPPDIKNVLIYKRQAHLTQEELHMLGTRDFEDLPFYLQDEVDAALEYLRAHPPGSTRGSGEARERYMKSPKGIEARRRAQKAYAKTDRGRAALRSAQTRYRERVRSALDMFRRDDSVRNSDD
jgi:hypothetical protein